MSLKILFKILPLFGFLAAFQINGFAQDPHLSQYFNTAVFTNPAAIGSSSAKLRLSGAYRKQWTGSNSPFTTAMFSADANLGNWGLGGIVLQDDAGPGSLKHINVAGGIGLKVEISPEATLRLGLQAGIIQRSFDPNQLQFDTQYIPGQGFNPNNSNGESFVADRVSLADLHTGILFKYRKAESVGSFDGLQVGIHLAHINEPLYSFGGDETIYPLTWKIHASSNFVINQQISLSPTAWVLQQANYREVAVGGNLNYRTVSEMDLSAGIHYRINDAIIPFFGIRSGNYDLGFSYDITLSALSKYPSLKGGLELTLGYRIGQGNKQPRERRKMAKVSTQDRDGDGILDHRDSCPDIPGIRRFGGCPDSDADGISDLEDLCPAIPGPVSTKGCPIGDRDGDRVLDPSDLCPDLPGEIAFQGCPDSDGDGLADSEDNCPKQAGAIQFGGCPASDIDADGDKIPNKIDACPTVPGSVRFQGCPDTDGDGLSDFEDHCPQRPGKVENLGCPDFEGDKDQDGILDEEDACPMIKGSIEFQGCPDSDGDGISDMEDRCPMLFGKKLNQGCPENGNQDVDGDGVLNTVDKCPYVHGLVNLFGCPDTDKDGLSDLDDECPLQKGSVDNRGCPGGNEMPQTYERQFGPVEFDTDQSVIKSYYFDMLSELATYLLNHPSINVNLIGHTDDEGDGHYNMVLGQNRSRSVSDYLNARGVSSSRIKMVSYGEIMPKSTNNSSQGRARNRRVEIVLSR